MLTECCLSLTYCQISSVFCCGKLVPRVKVFGCWSLFRYWSGISRTGEERRNGRRLVHEKVPFLSNEARKLPNLNRRFTSSEKSFSTLSCSALDQPFPREQTSTNPAPSAPLSTHGPSSEQHLQERSATNSHSQCARYRTPPVFERIWCRVHALPGNLL